MSEKRFKLCDGVKLGSYSGVWDNKKQNHQRTGDELWVGEVIGMLNEGIMIVEQNKELRKELQLSNDYNIILEERIEAYENSDNITELENEIAKLKKEIMLIEKNMDKCYEENKELKQQLEAFKDKLCELGVSDVKLYGKRYYTGLEEWLE